MGDVERIELFLSKVQKPHDAHVVLIASANKANIVSETENIFLYIYVFLF